MLACWRQLTRMSVVVTRGWHMASMSVRFSCRVEVHVDLTPGLLDQQHNWWVPVAQLSH
jgi:hypothetical protein